MARGRCSLSGKTNKEALMHSTDDAAARRVREAFKKQADWCDKHGSSPFTAFLCSLFGERLDKSTLIGRRVLSWPGDPRGQADALALRVCGALHGLARSNLDPA